MGATQTIATAFRMTDESWRRHANPWSVWTRFAAIPAVVLAIWSRTWIGWWCLRRSRWLCSGCGSPSSASSSPSRSPAAHCWHGTDRPRPWPTIFGATLIVLAQLWRIDRFGWL